MDEDPYLNQIRLSPGNTKLLRDYADWLIGKEDPRGEYLETELEFREAEARIAELRKRMYEITVVRGLDMNWLDVVHPLFVTAIVDGIFFLAETPENRPFIREGEPVAPDTIVGMLEIGTVPNQIAAGFHGYVSEIVASNGQSVQCGDILMRLVRLSPR